MKKLFALLFAAGLLSLAVGCPPATTRSTSTTPPAGYQVPGPPPGMMPPGGPGHMGPSASEKAGTEKGTDKAAPAGTEKAGKATEKDTKK